ncbi:MAG: DUF1156 domain-containing protein [Acidimicrobiia bacterium]|nr:DUF1156 domain-containing protein [Acidimicrobiia bacterium]
MKRKLIEVALPLDIINAQSAREKSIRHGHPSTLHLWWARRPLAACRAVLFAQLVDDPSSDPDHFPTEEAQDAERQRLFRILERLVPWEALTDEAVLAEANAEIRRSCGDELPTVLDPFAGGGSIPLEAQRLGLSAVANDLNPVAVLINKALIEIPPVFGGRPPIHPDAERRTRWAGAEGLAEDVRRYGQWMSDEAETRIGANYPSATTPGGASTVIAWIWARTATCSNPACRGTMPLLNSYALSRKKGREAWLDPVVDRETKTVTFRIGTGAGCPPGGTVSRTGATCLICGTNVPLAHVRAEGKAGRMGAQLVCTVADGPRQRVYLPADPVHADAARVTVTDAAPDTDLPEQALGFRVQGYGITKHRQLFTDRQLVALTTFVDVLGGLRARALADGADERYADALVTYLSLGIGRLANRCSSQCFWDPGGEGVMQVFARNALPMVWVFAEANPFSEASGNFTGQLEYLANALERVPARGHGTAAQADAAHPPARERMVIATDPPYYDNVPYADLSDFFYVWLRQCLSTVHPELFGTVLVPKAEELIAEPARQGSWDEAASFFETGLRTVFARILDTQVEGIPFTVFYAFKQSEAVEDVEGNIERASTGWETMLQGLLDAGAMITGTWPMRTEQPGGLREVGRSALASSIVLVCRPREVHAGMTDRRGFLTALRAELPQALRDLQKGNTAPVDLAQASIGPGMAVYSRYAKVVEPDGSPMRVRAALGLINQTLDEVLSELDADFDPRTRWAVKWFEQFGFDEGPSGQADVLFTATATSLDGVKRAGIAGSSPGKVWLLGRPDLPADWDPTTDTITPVWEVTMHLLKRLEERGEAAAGGLLSQVGGVGDTARELAYRLFAICSNRKWASEALALNGLVTSWPEIARLAASGSRNAEQGTLL